MNLPQTFQQHLKITGRVQGVGFRHFTRQQAKEIGIKGWVRNMPDGSVETLLSGDEDQIEEMKRRLRKGPISSKVERIDEVQFEGVDSEFVDFKVLR